jgi:two-component system OmpR family response regulator
MTSVLLVDDDRDFVALLKQYLERESFAVATAYDGDSGLASALTSRVSIVVLDLMMPQLNGIEILRRLRRQSAVPVLILTAKGDDSDRIVGLELGADDYVTKPCTPRELTARLRAIMRRTRANPVTSEAATDANVVVAGSLVMWPERRHAEWCSMPLHLTSAEFGLLEILARNVGRPVNKAELSRLGLGRPLAPFDRSIDVHLSSIRRKLGALPDGRSRIQTVFRKGYQLIKE